MRILLIGNFAPPYEEESLHNLSLMRRLEDEGHECKVIHIDETSGHHPVVSPHDSHITFIKNYIDFIIKFLRHALSCRTIHFLTKGYTRPGLMKLVTAVFLGRLMLKRIIITLHPEMFSVFGQLRSKMGGQQLLRLSFALSHKIICGDAHTHEVASSHYSSPGKYIIIPPFFQGPETAEADRPAFVLPQNIGKIIVISGITYPSLLFDVISRLLMDHLDENMGVVLAIAEQKSRQLEHVFQDIKNSCPTDRLVFVPADDDRILAAAYARAELVIRSLSCDGRPLFNNIALIIKNPCHSENDIYFSPSLILIKEGEASDLIARTVDALLKEKSRRQVHISGNFFEQIREIYS